MARGEKKTEAIRIRLEPSVKKKLERLAKEAHRTPSGEVRLAIEKHLRAAA